MSDEEDKDKTSENSIETSSAMDEAAQAAMFADLMTDETAATEELSAEQDLEVILDIPVTLSVEIGHTKVSIRKLLSLGQGSVVELDRLAGEPLDIKINGTLIAHGEVVVVNDKFGIRLTDIISTAERIQKLK